MDILRNLFVKWVNPQLRRQRPEVLAWPVLLPRGLEMLGIAMLEAGYAANLDNHKKNDYIEFLKETDFKLKDSDLERKAAYGAANDGLRFFHFTCKNILTKELLLKDRVRLYGNLDVDVVNALLQRDSKEPVVSIFRQFYDKVSALTSSLPDMPPHWHFALADAQPKKAEETKPTAPMPKMILYDDEGNSINKQDNLDIVSKPKPEEDFVWEGVSVEQDRLFAKAKLFSLLGRALVMAQDMTRSSSLIRVVRASGTSKTTCFAKTRIEQASLVLVPAVMTPSFLADKVVHKNGLRCVIGGALESYTFFLQPAVKFPTSTKTDAFAPLAWCLRRTDDAEEANMEIATIGADEILSLNACSKSVAFEPRAESIVLPILTNKFVLVEGDELVLFVATKEKAKVIAKPLTWKDGIGASSKKGKRCQVPPRCTL
jgi:hypothetical protein